MRQNAAARLITSGEKAEYFAITNVCRDVRYYISGSDVGGEGAGVKGSSDSLIVLSLCIDRSTLQVSTRTICTGPKP
jgi:hypothetical protein